MENYISTGLGYKIKQLSNIAFSQYEPMVRQVEQGKINDISEIERLLDGLFDFCYSPKILLLYKRIFMENYQ